MASWPEILLLVNSHALGANVLVRGVLAALAAASSAVTVFFIARACGVSFVLGLSGIDSMGGLTWYLVAAVDFKTPQRLN